MIWVSGDRYFKKFLKYMGTSKVLIFKDVNLYPYFIPNEKSKVIIDSVSEN